MGLTRQIIEQVQSENAMVVEIVAMISEIFEEREIPRNERRRILGKVEQYTHLAWTINPEHVQDFPHGTESDDEYQIAKRAAEENKGLTKEEFYEGKLQFWSVPRTESDDTHGESDDIVLAQNEEE